MSEPANANTTPDAASAPKKKKGKLFIIIGLIFFLAAGGAGGFYFWSKSKAEAAETAEAEEKPAKKSSKKESKKEDKSEESASEFDGALPDDENVKHVVELQPFIVNLTDSEDARYLRMTVSLGVGEEGGEKPDPLFLTRVKNAMLTVLTTKKSEDVLTTEGKAKLRSELLKAAQAASEKPHVEAIYITDFIVQL